MCMQDPCLELIGPVRGIMVIDPMKFEVVLKVKGSTESEDKDLSFLVVWYICDGSESRSHVINKIRTSKLSTLELTFGHIVRSVESTISVRVIGGSWPDGFQVYLPLPLEFSSLAFRNLSSPME